jgi:NAD(P)-dependent dehydrogenase (short-subunit alcohol dehydrogenase family)
MCIAQTTPDTVCPACAYNIPPLTGRNNGSDVNLAGVTVFMTGGSRGIGLTTSLFLASRGATVYSCARTPLSEVENRTQIIAAGIKYRECDVRFPDSFDHIVEEFEDNDVKIDMFISVAGIMFFGTPNDITTRQHRDIFRTNTEAFTTLWRAFRSLMNPAPAVVTVAGVPRYLNASVFVISSSTADFLSPFLSHYSGSKIDLDRNTQSVAWANIRKPLRFCILLPALTKTTVLQNSYLPRRSECLDKVMWNYNATLQRMQTSGQDPLVVSESILHNYLSMPYGVIGRYSASTPVAYAEFVFLANIYAKNQLDTAIDSYQSIFATAGGPGSPGVDPVC